MTTEQTGAVIGNCTLLLGDCRELLPTLTYGQHTPIVISDPPYGIGYVHSGGGSGIHAATKRGQPEKAHTFAKMKIHGDDEPFDPVHLLGYQHLLLWGANHFAQKLPRGGTWVCWDKNLGIGPKDSFTDAEFAWTNLKVKRNVIRFLWKGMACQKMGEEGGKRYHPTTKPQGVMLQCLDFIPKTISNPIVLDPYMGSGSTGVACAARGLPFVGIEIDQQHFDMACQRIDQAQRQDRMFIEPKPEQSESQQALIP